MKKWITMACCTLLITVATAQRIASARSMVSAACKTAKAENKNVLVIFHASWCGWCKKMDASLNDPACKAAFDQNYVITHITVMESDDKKELENPGGEELMKQYKADKAGLPFWVILDANGNVLFNSFMIAKDGKEANMGCPAAEAEVKEFITTIKATSTMKEGQLEAIRKVFRKNEN